MRLINDGINGAMNLDNKYLMDIRTITA